MRVDGSNLPPLSSFVGGCARLDSNISSILLTARVRGGNNGEIYERWRNKVDAMVTGRMAPIILLAVWSDSLGFAGRRNARRALDSNPFM